MPFPQSSHGHITVGGLIYVGSDLTLPQAAVVIDRSLIYIGMWCAWLWCPVITHLLWWKGNEMLKIFLKKCQWLVGNDSSWQNWPRWIKITVLKKHCSCKGWQKWVDWRPHDSSNNSLTSSCSQTNGVMEASQKPTLWSAPELQNTVTNSLTYPACVLRSISALVSKIS